MRAPFADGRKVRLLRDNKIMIIDVNKIRANPTLDVPVEPGARIEVPSIFQNSKNSQGDLQQAQHNADLASSQRAALEARLKKAEENLQLAQKRADLATKRSVPRQLQRRMRTPQRK